MISFALFLAVLIIGALALQLTKKETWVDQQKRSLRPIGIIRGVIVLGVAILAALINPIKVELINPGHVGIKVNKIGDNRGVSSIEYVNGYVPYISWTSSIYEFPTRQGHIEYEERVVITRGGFQTTIKPSFNYSINPGAVADMFQNLRSDVQQIEQQWLKNAIISSVNDVANLYTVDSIFNHRAEFETAIVLECNKRVSKWFTVSQLLTNIQPPDALKQAIEAKTKAIQDVQVAENQRLVANAVRDRKIAEARGDSAKMVIEAAGESESIRRRQEALAKSPVYVQYLLAQKWDGAYPQVMSGSGSGLILQLPKQE